MIEKKVFDFFVKSDYHVSFTTDIWTALNQQAYMAVTAHYISEKFELINFIIDFSHIPFPHSGKEIAYKFKEPLNQF